MRIIIIIAVPALVACYTYRPLPTATPEPGTRVSVDLTDAGSVELSNQPATVPVPGRMPYGETEINANPHTPTVDPTGRNANDPNPCPVLNYSTSVPLAN